MEASLTDNDLKNLVSAVEAWESSLGSGKAMGQLMATILAPKEVQESEEWKKKMAEADKEHEDQLALRKETATLLKAKLIMMRQAAAIERLRTES